MPISVKTTPGGTVGPVPLLPAQLPVELYFRLVFDTSATAEGWCTEAVRLCETVALNEVAGKLDRIVVWGPKPAQPGVRVIGRGEVFVSELALRVVRALLKAYVPSPEPVSLGQFPHDLHCYAGADADRRAYEAIRR